MAGPRRPPADKPARRTTHLARPKRRWLKWTLIGTSAIVVIALGLAGGIWYYVNEQVGHVHHFAGPVNHLRFDPPPGAPMDILLIGSDSRKYAAGHPSIEAHVGNASVQTGQRSDVIIVARLIPATHHVVMLSIPRDSWVPIYGTGGSQRINTAFNNGPSQLVATITHDFGIPIDHVVQATFPGFTNIVNALGGVYLNFPDPVRDFETGLRVHHPGCQLLNGTQALELVRSRHLEYRTSLASTVWQYDGMSDWSRIRRQQAFFHAVIDRAHENITNPFSMLRFVHAVTADLTVDKGLTTSLMERLGWSYRHAGNADLTTMVLPTYGTYINGAAVVLPAQPYANQVIKSFLAAGTKAPSTSKSSAPPSTSPKATTTTVATGVPATTVPRSEVVFDTAPTLPEPWNPVPCMPG